jgi:hypothetical protein
MLSTLSATDTRGLCFYIIHMSICLMTVECEVSTSSTAGIKVIDTPSRQPELLLRLTLGFSPQVIFNSWLAAPPNYSSAGFGPSNLFLRAISASILFECRCSVPRITSSGLQRLHIIRVRMLYPSNCFIRPSTPLYYLSMG